MFFSTDIMHHI